MLKVILLILVGIIAGWLINSQQQTGEQVELSLVMKMCPEFFDQVALSETQLDTSPPSVDTSQHKLPNCDSPSANAKNNNFETIDDIIVRLLKNRSILHADLSALSLWHSFDDFEAYLNRFKLTSSELHRLLAKARIYFDQNYIIALENLYSARQSANGIDSEKNIQGEINALISFIRNTYFSLDSTIHEDVFLRFMDIAYEKQPDYLPVILALTKHYLFTKDYELTKNYIDAIPVTPENQQTIDLMVDKLKHSIEEIEASSGGIPMTKRGDHFVVKVNINQDIQLNLMLDTGASHTVVSPATMRSMLKMSRGIIDLEAYQHVRTANGYVRTHLYKANELDIGGFKLDKPIILTSNLVHDDAIHGLLGMDFLGQFQFRIDHQKNLLYLSY